MIKFELTDFERLRKMLDPSVVEKALDVAIHRTAMKVRTTISKDVRKVYPIKAGEIKQAVTLIKPNLISRNSVTERVLSYSGFRLSLGKFKSGKGVRRVSTRAGSRYQAKVKDRKGSAARLVDGGFWGTAQRSGSQQIFQRIGPERLKIKKLTAPSVAHMVRNVDVVNKFQNAVELDLPIQFDKALRAKLGEFKK